MTTKMVQINCETQEIIEREMTSDEIKAEKQMQDYAEKVNTQNSNKEAAKSALLDKLGITAEEANLLLS